MVIITADKQGVILVSRQVVPEMDSYVANVSLLSVGLGDEC